MKLASKSRFYALWNKGLLGNRLRCWDGVEKFKRSEFNGHVMVRSSTMPAWLGCRWNLTLDEALEAARSCPNPQFNEMAPDDALLIQGEVARAVGGLALTYSCVPGLRMREGMKIAKRAQGLTAKCLIEAHLWPPCVDDLEALWDIYPDAVIEFSAYRHALGDQQGRNTLIWEVRDY